MPNEANEVRRNLFETLKFRDEAADRLTLDKAMVSNAVAALLEAGSIPCTNPDNAGALAVDGARILVAIGSRVRPTAIARVRERFCAMTVQIDTPNRNTTAVNRPQRSASFETDWPRCFVPSEGGERRCDLHYRAAIAACVEAAPYLSMVQMLSPDIAQVGGRDEDITRRRQRDGSARGRGDNHSGTPTVQAEASCRLPRHFEPHRNGPTAR